MNSTPFAAALGIARCVVLLLLCVTAGCDCGGDGDRIFDAPVVLASIQDVVIAEGDAKTTTAGFTLALTHAASTETQMRVHTTAGTATTGTDFLALDQIIAIPAGALSAQFSVDIVGDLLVEPDETFEILLSLVSGTAAVGDPAATCTIVNDDVATAAGLVLFAGDYDTAGQNELYTVSIDGGLPTRISAPVANTGVSHIRLAADKTRVFYLSATSTSNNLTLGHLVNIDGTGHVELTPTDRNIVDGEWSPDGSRIMYLAESPIVGSPGEVYVANADGSAPLLVSIPVAAGDSIERVEWSPTSNMLSYVHHAGVFYHSLYAVNADGSASTQIDSAVETPLPGSRLWSPDGTRLYMKTSASALESGQHSYIVSAAPDGTGRVSHAQALSGYFYDVAWAPDGSQIAVASVDAGVVTPALGGSPSWTTAWGTGASTQIAWAPDGSRVLFLQRWSEGSVFLAAWNSYVPDGSSWIPLSPGVPSPNEPLVGDGIWSHDSQYFAYESLVTVGTSSTCVNVARGDVANSAVAICQSQTYPLAAASLNWSSTFPNIFNADSRWSHDNARVLFAGYPCCEDSGGDGASGYNYNHLLVNTVDGTSLVNLGPAWPTWSGRIEGAAWTQDDSRVIHVSQEELPGSLYFLGLYSVLPDGTDRHYLIPGWAVAPHLGLTEAILVE